MCTLLLVVLVLPVFCQVVYSEPEVLTLDDLPTLYGSLTIRSDSILTINEGESGAVEGVLVLQGDAQTTPEFEIVNNGDLIIKNTVVCNTANFTIKNNGNLTFEDVVITLDGDASLSVSNDGTCALSDANINVYGGLFYLTSTTSLTAHNLYIKDQFDGTLIANYGEADFSESTFVTNGAYGKIEIFNAGQLRLNHGVFDLNYGGTVNINSLQGTLEVSETTFDASGWSHGKQSQANILAAKATWETCSFVSSGGSINYQSHGELNMTDSQFFVSSLNGSTIFSNFGPMAIKESVMTNDGGSLIVTNWDSMNIIETTYNTSKTMNVMNNGDITAENWHVKTVAAQAQVLIFNDGNITINTSFIENVDSSELTSIGPEGKEFVESSGGTIAITNNGSIKIMVTPSGGSDSNLIYILLLIIAVIVVVVLFLFRRRKPRYTF
jgi:hypothetical protein